MSDPVLQTEDDILRKALFVRCATKRDLHQWIKVYLGLNLPDTIVDEVSGSNSSPMDLIWEVYEKGIEGNDPDFSRIMAYASRDSFKTLGAAILEVLAVLHLNRDVAHMAAVKAQAEKAQSYVKKFFRFPYLKDFVVGQNMGKTDIYWYSNKETGNCLTKKQYEALLPEEQQKYTEHSRYIKIVICTMQGANSEHVPFFVVDEVDVVPKQNQAAYQEAKSIPAIFEGNEPITLLTSTRKFAFGNVQRELEAKDKTGLIERHWNIIDVTERCPPKRHLPEQPRIPIYFSKGDFSSISEKEFEALGESDREKYERDEGYAGCLSKCKLFAMCRGQLATKQVDHPRDEKGRYTENPAPLLKTITFTTNKFRELTLDMAKAQLMCWQASQEGLIFSSLEERKHLLTAAQIASKLTGEPVEQMSFEELIRLCRSRDGKWMAGIDHGFTHVFSVVLMYVDGQRGFVLGRWQQAGLDPAEKIALLDRTIQEFAPIIIPDTAQPDMNKFIRRHGYSVREWDKGPGSVLSGIETVKYKLSPGITAEPQLMFCREGPGVQSLFKALQLYHWALGNDGKPTNEPDEVIYQTEDGDRILDDEVDALRYVVMNTFKTIRAGATRPDEPVAIKTPAQMREIHAKQQPMNHVWARQILDHAMGVSVDGFDDPTAPQSAPEDSPTPKRGGKGGFFWDMS